VTRLSGGPRKRNGARPGRSRLSGVAHGLVAVTLLSRIISLRKRTVLQRLVHSSCTSKKVTVMYVHTAGLGDKQGSARSWNPTGGGWLAGCVERARMGRERERQAHMRRGGLAVARAGPGCQRGGVRWPHVVRTRGGDGDGRWGWMSRHHWPRPHTTRPPVPTGDRAIQRSATGPCATHTSHFTLHSGDVAVITRTFACTYLHGNVDTRETHIARCVLVHLLPVHVCRVYMGTLVA
jgi:hypothetical protein